MLAVGIPAQTPRPVGSVSECASCHASASLAQPQTPMGRALQLAGKNPTLLSHPKLTFQKWGFTYLIETKGSDSTYSVGDGSRTITLPIHWTFGKGAQTWVFERDGVYYESLVSYYPSIDGLAVTTGDEGLLPKTLDEAVGRKLGNMEVKDCFRCHSTRSVARGQLDLNALEEGVTCEHCHQGSNAHMTGGFQGKFAETAPPDLGKLTSEDISNFCGQCHRSWEMVVRGKWRGEINVRFQPYRLANSKCFDGTDPRISCIASHDPHQDVVRETKSYDAKCLACHSAGNTTGTGLVRANAKICPKATSDCASCHMPAVKLPNGLMTFHDHQIRVVKPGVPYPD